MKANKQFLLSIATVLMALTTINCGGGSGSNSTPATPIGAFGASCGANMLTSQYGCLPQCGPSSVIYQNQCMPITQNGYGQYGQGQYGQGQYGQGQYPGGTQYGGNQAICQGMCPAGLVQVTGQMGPACLPVQSCNACYGQSGGYCYMGDFAHQFYGY